MVHSLELAITAAVMLGILAQWVAWRLGLPAIVLLAGVGLLLGPGLGWVNPSENLGAGFHTLTGFAVAIILFEGGFSLKTDEIRGMAHGVARLISLGVILAWALGTLAAHYIAGLAWPLAITLAAILVVTGPTVVGPLLRQARLLPRPASLFKWEGIINDPIGALLAFVSFEYALSAGGANNEPLWALTSSLLGALVAALVLGAGAGWGVARIFQTRWAPEFLKVPSLLATVMLVYTAANGFMQEAGLLATTAMGMVMGNMQLADAPEIRRFKENVGVFLITLLFVLLTADVEPTTLMRLDLSSIAFVAAMLVLVRPAAILLATLGSTIPWRERLLLGWIAPRGVVAAALSGILGQTLAEAGLEGAELLFPLTFTVILTTVLLHGLTFRPLAYYLGLTAGTPHGILIVGASPWTIQLAQRLHEDGVRVLLADSSAYRLSAARSVGIPTYAGELLSDLGRQQLDLAGIGNLLAATENNSYNALVCNRFARELGRDRVFQLPEGTGTDETAEAFSDDIRGRTAFSEDATQDEMTRRYYTGWHFEERPIFSRATMQAPCPEEAEPLLVLRRDGDVEIYGAARQPAPRAGDRVFCYSPPAEPEEEESDEADESEAVEETPR